MLIPLSPEAYITILTLAYFGATSVIPDINLHEEELRRLLLMADVQLIISTKDIADEKLKGKKVAILDAFHEVETHQSLQFDKSERFR